MKDCSCEWCDVRSPLFKKIQIFLQDNEEEKTAFDNIINDLMIAETDAVYWKDKYFGTWPSDTAEDIQNHIERLQVRKHQLEIKKDYDS
jgi:hypothetical protein